MPQLQPIGALASGEWVMLQLPLVTLLHGPCTGFC